MANKSVHVSGMQTVNHGNSLLGEIFKKLARHPPNTCIAWVILLLRVAQSVFLHPFMCQSRGGLPSLRDCSVLRTWKQQLSMAGLRGCVLKLLSWKKKGRKGRKEEGKWEEETEVRKGRKGKENWVVKSLWFWSMSGPIVLLQLGSVWMTMANAVPKATQVSVVRTEAWTHAGIRGLCRCCCCRRGPCCCEWLALPPEAMSMSLASAAAEGSDGVPGLCNGRGPCWPPWSVLPPETTLNSVACADDAGDHVGAYGRRCLQKPCVNSCSVLPWTVEDKKAAFAIVLMTAES